MHVLSTPQLVQMCFSKGTALPPPPALPCPVPRATQAGCLPGARLTSLHTPAENCGCPESPGYSPEVWFKPTRALGGAWSCHLATPFSCECIKPLRNSPALFPGQWKDLWQVKGDADSCFGVSISGNNKGDQSPVWHEMHNNEQQPFFWPMSWDRGLLKSLLRPYPIARSLPSTVAMARRDNMEAADKSLS